MINSPVSDMLIRLKNGYLAHKDTIDVPFSKLKKELSEILVKNNFLTSYSYDENSNLLKLVLKYNKQKPALTDVKIISKPSLRIYKGYKEIPRTLSGLGITILTTSKGLKTDKEARKEHLGGEILCQIW